MMNHIIHKFESTVESLRSKATRDGTDRTSQQASLVVGIAKDAQECCTDIPKAEIDNNFIDAFINSDPNLMIALEDALKQTIQ